jgi:hypothetical protein
MTYHVVAANHAESSENRIHSDDVARRYGFTGALVPGVAVFGYMSHEVTASLGLGWLGGSTAAIRLLKPAYAGDVLSIDARSTAGHRLDVECRNAEGALLATLAVDAGGVLPAVDPRAEVVGRTPNPERRPIHWDAVHVDEPFATFVWQPTSEENHAFTAQVSDTEPAYREGLLHPHLTQHIANMTLVRRFVLPAWVHVGTEMCFRRALRVGDAIEIRTLPIERWERKGHQFVKLYIAYVVEGAPAVEAYHTAIFRLAERGT